MTETADTVAHLAAWKGGPMALDKALGAARASLDTIDREGPWAYADGYWPETRSGGGGRATVALDAPTGPDDVPGPRWDTGLGSYHARAAYRTALGEVALADNSLGLVLVLAAVHYQPAFPQWPVPINATELRRLTRGVRWRLERLEGLYPDVDRQLRGLMRGVVEGGLVRKGSSVVARLDRAALELGGAMQAGARDGLGAVVVMCRYGCGRPAAPKKGGKCHVCHQADYRGRGSDARVGARAERLELRRIHARHRAAGHGHGYD